MALRAARTVCREAAPLRRVEESGGPASTLAGVPVSSQGAGRSKLSGGGPIDIDADRTLRHGCALHQ
eukprot:2503131-Prymnesium_polylepis.1